jgi:hypothetical protein
MVTDTEDYNLSKNMIYGLPPIDFPNLESSIKQREEIERMFEEERIPDWEYFTKYGNNAEILERDRLIFLDLQIIIEEIRKIDEEEHRAIQRILKRLI